MSRGLLVVRLTWPWPVPYLFAAGDENYCSALYRSSPRWVLESFAALASLIWRVVLARFGMQLDQSSLRHFGPTTFGRPVFQALVLLTGVLLDVPWFLALFSLWLPCTAAS